MRNRRNQPMAITDDDADPDDHSVVTPVELLTELPPVMGHSGQLQEVMINLVQNAIDAM